jgi:hypothetical protein
MANWFVYLYKNKDLLKNFYDFKHAPQANSHRNNQSGDSGMGAEFMNASALSTASSLLSNHNIAMLSQKGFKSADNNNVMVTSLSNVSIFENEEYFAYFHKLVEQFSYIEFNLKLFRDNEKPSVVAQQQQPTKASAGDHDLTPTASPPSHIIQQQFRYQEEAESQMNHLLENHLKSNSYSNQAVVNNSTRVASKKKLSDASSVSYASSKGLATKSSHTISNGSAPNNHAVHGGNSSGSGSSNGGGFNLKSISKKFNIKSWFGGNSSHNLSAKPPIGSSKTTASISSVLKASHSKSGQHSGAVITVNSSTSAHKDRIGMVGCGVGTLVNNSNSTSANNNLMKHSLSESNINQYLK